MILIWLKRSTDYKLTNFHIPQPFVHYLRKQKLWVKDYRGLTGDLHWTWITIKDQMNDKCMLYVIGRTEYTNLLRMWLRAAKPQ